MKQVATLLLLVALAAETRVYGVVGCVTPASELAARSDVVVVGKIDHVVPIALQPCPTTIPREAEIHASGYHKCGNILSYAVTVAARLRGEAPDSIVVRVPLPDYLSLSCDDRPDPDKMAGVYAILFLERSGEFLWMVDGPDGVHGSWSPLSASEIADMRQVVESVPRRDSQQHER